MITLIRKTISGSEYWDAKNKKILFVPTGKDPDFEVTDNPESMIYEVDQTSGKDKTVVNDKAVDPDGSDPGLSPNLDEMNIGQLIAFAEQRGINVPGNMKKEDTIRKYITEQLTDDPE